MVEVVVVEELVSAELLEVEMEVQLELIQLGSFRLGRQQMSS